MGKKVSPSVVEQILKLDAEGWAQRRIAEAVGLRHETICRILHKYHDRAFDRIVGKLAAVRSRHACKLEHAADLAMQSFVESSKPTAQFLSVYMEALREIRSVLGIANRLEPEADVPGAGSLEVTEALQRIAEMRRQKLGVVGADDGQGQGQGDQGDGGPGQDRPGGRDDGGAHPPDRPPAGGDQGGQPYVPVAPWLLG
jgi:hypothetical protein